MAEGFLAEHRHSLGHATVADLKQLCPVREPVYLRAYIHVPRGLRVLAAASCF